MPLWKRHRRSRPGLDARAQADTWQLCSLLLDYPDEQLVEWLPLLRSACETLPPGCSGPFGRLVDHLSAAPLRDLQACYVETFDNRRRHSLFLTYFAHGDTRKRGVALLRFKQTYLRSGFVLSGDGRGAGELPDHLCVVLEYAATVDHRLGWGLLLDHRAGLEILRMSLRDEGSPWAGAVEAVCATLPPLGGEERDAVRRLAAAGPPEEEVGLTPYATPGFDPGPAPPPGVPRPEALPMPTFPGGR